jgi:hypothetical protein
MRTNATFDPFAPLKTLIFFEVGLILFLLAALASCVLTLAWGLYHCMRYFPEGQQKQRWLLIVCIPIAGPLAYAFGGRPISANKNLI